MPGDSSTSTSDGIAADQRYFTLGGYVPEGTTDEDVIKAICARLRDCPEFQDAFLEPEI